MGLSNLPPGVTESMIPGNRPEDWAWDKLWDWIQDTGLTPEEIREAIETWMEVRDHTHELDGGEDLNGV